LGTDATGDSRPRWPGGCTVSPYRDGKIARAWVYWDALRLMRQLGVIPAPPAKS